MSPEWGTLPLLPLRCILDHLSLEDAMAAMSTCRHWRSTILLYEGRKEILRVRTKHFEKSLYVARVFRKHTSKLHVYLDGSDENLDNFMDYILPIFFDTAKLREMVFIGPSYILQNHHVPVIKLKRIITESLLYKHRHSLERFALLGCELGVAKGETENLSPKHLDYYARHLYFSQVASPSDTVLSRCTEGVMAFSALQHLIVDYEHINTEALESLTQQAPLSRLTLNVRYKRNLLYQRLRCPRKLQVAVNIISIPSIKFDEIIENVLCEGMCLVSLKVLFCKMLYPPLIEHIVRVHKETLQELVWADAPYNSTDVYHRVVRPMRRAQFGINNVNPFILLCWQCTQLRRLVIHGYWVWQYDLVGFVRLRASLRELQVSAVHARQDHLGHTTPRVLASDVQHDLHPQFLQEMNAYASNLWRPTAWSTLPRALRLRSSPAQRALYAAHEALRPAPALSCQLGVT